MKKMIFAFLWSTLSFGYGIGISTHPMPEGQKFLSTEVTGSMSNTGGIGIQARYVKRPSDHVTFDIGMGFSDSSRSNRFFASTDIEFYRDYGKQPRISLRAMAENAEEFGSRRNIIGIAPVFSKGFSFWGKEGYPFLSFPVNLLLDDDTKHYEFRSNATIGITGKMKTGTTEFLVYNLEGNINVRNGFSAMFFGLSYPLN